MEYSKHDYEKREKFVHEIKKSAIDVENPFKNTSLKAYMLLARGVRRLHEGNGSYLDLRTIHIPDLKGTDIARIGNAFRKTYFSDKIYLERFMDEHEHQPNDYSWHIEDYHRAKKPTEVPLDMDENGDVETPPELRRIPLEDIVGTLTER